MPSMSNLLYAMPFVDLPDEVADNLKREHDEKGEVEFNVIPFDAYTNLLKDCKRHGLLAAHIPVHRTAEKRYGKFEFEIFMEPDYDEDWPDAWVGVSLTSRYSPTLADTSDSGGCWPFRFDDRMTRIQQMAEFVINNHAPDWFKGEWIVKEAWY